MFHTCADLSYLTGVRMRPSGAQHALGYSASVLGGSVTLRSVHDGDLHLGQGQRAGPCEEDALMF